MKHIALASLLLAGALFSQSCAGVRQTDDTFAAHGECFRIFGFPIPSDDLAAARAQVPAGATVTSVRSTPADWTSFWGFFGNLFWFNTTTISGTK